MASKAGLIYGLTDPRTGHLRYIGKTLRTLTSRLGRHLRDTGRNHRCNWIRGLNRMGMRPGIMLLESVPPEHLNDAEISMIAFIRSAGATLLNGTDGGDGGRSAGSIGSIERANTSKRFKGKPLNLFHRHLLSVAKKGKKQSPEHVEKVASQNRGKARSESSRKKTSDRLKQRRQDPAHAAYYARMVAAAHSSGASGKRVKSVTAAWADPETRQRIVAGLRGKWADPAFRERHKAGIRAAHERRRLAKFANCETITPTPTP